MHSVQYQCWAPKQSPVRIEFRAGLLDDVSRASTSGQSRGLLYGVRQGADVRILEAESGSSQPKDSGLDQFEKIGIFICRERGEVFLTEPDLKWFEQHEAKIALVIAGARAGFFVHQADGSIQTVCSHEEFSLATTVASAAGEARDFPAARTMKSRARSTAGFITTLAVLAVPIATLAYLRPPSTPPAQLQLRGQGELAIVSWNPRATAHGGQLEIFDGGKKTVMGVLPGQSSLTYAPHSVAIEVQLTTDGAAGQPQQESARLITEVHPSRAESESAQPGPPAAERVRAEVAALEEESNRLRQSITQGHTRIARLEQAIASLTHH